MTEDEWAASVITEAIELLKSIGYTVGPDGELISPEHMLPLWQQRILEHERQWRVEHAQPIHPPAEA